MNGILCAYFRATAPSTPSVEATALQPPSIASFTMFSGSKYIGFGANEAPAGMLDALIDRQNGHVTGSRQPPVADQRLQTAKHANGAIRHAVNALDVVGTRADGGSLWERSCTDDREGAQRPRRGSFPD